MLFILFTRFFAFTMKSGQEKYTTAEASEMTREFTIPCLLDFDTLKHQFRELILQSNAKASQRISYNNDFINGKTRNSSSIKRKDVGKNAKESAGRQLRPRECEVRRDKKRKSSEHPKEVYGAKPGTAGSRQAMNAPKRGSRAKKTSNYESDSDDSIYTSNIVDGNIVYSAIELKQKLQAYEAPSDPKDWCKGFHIEIPFLDLRIEPTPPSKPEGNGVSAKLVSEEFKSPED